MKWGESECGQERLSKISCCCPLTNGAPTLNAPLVIQVTNGAPSGGAPLVVLQKNILMVHCSTVRHYQFKLVMAHGGKVCHQQFGKKGNKNIIEKTTLVAHFPAGAPLLVTTSNGALGLDAPLLCLDRRTSQIFFDTNGAPWARCAITSCNH